MYGIKRPPNLILCYFGKLDQLQFCMQHQLKRPVMLESQAEVDNLLQQCMVSFSLYDLIVFKYTEEEEKEILIKNLKGY